MATPSPTRANTAGPKPPHAAGSDGASQQTTTASTSVSASLPSSTPSTATSTPASTLVGALKPLASKIARKESPSSATSNPTALPPPATTKDNAEGGAGVSLGLSTTQLGASSAPSPSVATPTNAGVDPLSQHIFTRTNTDTSFVKQHRLRNSTTGLPESSAPTPEPVARQSTDLASKIAINSTDAVKDKKKGSSLLSRLGIRKPKGDADSIPDTDSQFSNEPRMNGTDARVFASIADAAGFVPHHKEPPRYIRVRAQNKKLQDREFDRMFLAQELVGTHPKPSDSETASNTAKIPIVTVSVAGAGGRRRERTGGAIWTTEFSQDGKHLAAAGKDGVVRIWAVISNPEERRAQEEDEAAVCPVGERLSAPVFRERPIREFSGHASEIVDLSWSKNGFLLSTGMDKTVMLWHVSRDECLCQFKHKDVVTKVAFHPTDDRFFLAGSLDMTLRLWSIPDKHIAWSATLPDLITAVAFTPDGKMALAGLLNGLCMLYETEGLKFHSQIHARSSRGKNSKGSKITGISTVAMPLTSGGKGTEPGEVKIMISTNDSRIRVYNLRDGSLDTKFKGHENACTQISATFSENAEYIITGSENRKAFIWKTSSSAVADSGKDKQPCESFDAHGDMVTTALFAPKKTRQLLSASGDPIYDLCNPPPVVLMSAEEAAASRSQVAPSEAGSHEQNHNYNQPQYSPAYLARTAHPDGNIIVTTDDQGVIKVFRQDCAHNKRRHDGWETASNLSRRRAGLNGHALNRTSSLSSAAHSRRGSLSTGPAGRISSDMINSWRHNIEGGRPNSIAGSMGTPARSERSVSPAKNVRRSATNLAADARKMPYYNSPLQTPVRSIASDVPDSPTSSSTAGGRRGLGISSDPRKSKPMPLQLAGRDEQPDTDKKPPGTPMAKVDSAATSQQNNPASPPVPSFSFRPAEGEDTDGGLMRLDAAGGSYGFWNLNRWKGLSGLKGGSGDSKKQHARTTSDAVLAGGEKRDGSAGTVDGARRKSLGSSVMSASEAADRRPSTHRRGPSLLGSSSRDDDTHLRADSVVSKLSSELTSESDVPGNESEGPCRKCSATKPKMKKVPGQPKQKVVCGRCGTVYS